MKNILIPKHLILSFILFLIVQFLILKIILVNDRSLSSMFGLFFNLPIAIIFIFLSIFSYLKFKKTTFVVICFFLHFPHHMPVHMTADIDCHRKSCNMCRVSIHIHCESSGCSAKSTRSDSKPIDFF